MRRAGIPEDSLRNCNDAEFLKAIALDETANLSERNEALNGLRMSKDAILLPLLSSILANKSWGPDYQSYAMQHLDLAMMHMIDQPGYVTATLGAYTSEENVIPVRREAIFGLLEIPTTRDYGLRVLSDCIRSGKSSNFGDLYTRALKDYNLPPDPGILACLDNQKK